MNGESQSIGPDPDSGRFLAGWIDGNRAGRTVLLETFRRTAGPLGWSCDADGRLFRKEEAAPREEESRPDRDNPEGDPAYDRGFDRGYREVVDRLSRELTIQLIPQGLFVVRGGYVMALDRVHDLVAAGLPRLPQSAVVTDEALHAFLDGAVPGSEATLPPPSPPLRASQPPRRIDRRTWIGLGLGAALTGAAAWMSIGLGSLGQRHPEPAGMAQTGGGYVAPTWWDDLPPASRDFYLGWDQLVWNLEQTTEGTANLHSALQTFLTTPGYDALKRTIVLFLKDSRRVAYHWDLLHALIPGVSAPNIHGSVLACLAAHVAELGPSVLTPTVVAGLVLYRDQGLAPNASCAEAATSLLAMVGL